jgi:transcriptional regulator with XRE-family HTH domain
VDIDGMSTKPNHARVYKAVPSFMRQLREDAGLTQRELAQVMKRSQWWIARIETGSRRIDIAEFIEFCQGCGVEPEKALRRLRE